MRTLKEQRLRSRLFSHHLPLFATSILSVAVLYYSRPYRDPLSRASFATAYPALVLLSATLLTGPWNVLRRQRNPVSSDLRRDIGIWAGVLGLVHTVVGQNVHLRGKPWLYYVYAQKEHRSFPLRHDLFGFSNYTGAVSCLLIIMLLAMSNDIALRSLGTKRWKSLQRWNYLTFALAAAHAIGYQMTEKQHPPFVLTITACVAITLGLQTLGFLARRSQRNPCECP